MRNKVKTTYALAVPLISEAFGWTDKIVNSEIGKYRLGVNKNGKRI